MNRVAPELILGLSLLAMACKPSKAVQIGPKDSTPGPSSPSVHSSTSPPNQGPVGGNETPLGSGEPGAVATNGTGTPLLGNTRLQLSVAKGASDPAFVRLQLQGSGGTTGNALEYACVSGCPAGLVLDPSSGTASFAANRTASFAPMVFSVSDGATSATASVQVNVSVENPIADCATDGQTNCFVGTGYKAAASALLVSENIYTGVTLGGAQGTVEPRPLDCASTGATSCVASTEYPAVTKSFLRAQEDFTTGSYNASLWMDGVEGTGSSIDMSTGALRISLPANCSGCSPASPSSAYLQMQDAFDFQNHEVSAELTTVTATGAQSETTIEVNFVNSSGSPLGRVGMRIEGTSTLKIRGYSGLGANFTSDNFTLDYDATLHRYWRFRHDQRGNLFFFQTSADNASWRTHYLLANPISDLSRARVRFDATVWGSIADPGMATFDKLRVRFNGGLP